MALTKFEKQTIILNQFDRVIRNANRSTEPSFIEKEMARSAKMKPANKTPQARISFYQPDNPLNGFAGKRKVDKIAILEKIKADKKAAK
jgi:hypothetical protein